MLAHSSAEREPLVLVSGSDDRFAMPLAVALYSALINLDRRVSAHVYILDDGISVANRQRIARVLQSAHPRASIDWLAPDVAAIDTLSPSAWNTRATYLRLLIPEILPRHHTRAIYVDSDLVVEADLGQLWRTSMADHLCLAVENYSDPTVATGLAQLYELIGLDPRVPYFNAGVLMMHLERWRTHRIRERVAALLQSYRDRTPFADQDGLNAVIAGQWGQLDPRWNVQQLTLEDYGPRRSLGRAESARIASHLEREAYILHYTGTRKPWHLRYRGIGQHRFLHYLRRSAWFAPREYVQWSASRQVAHIAWTLLYRIKRTVPRRAHLALQRARAAH